MRRRVRSRTRQRCSRRHPRPWSEPCLALALVRLADHYRMLNFLQWRRHRRTYFRAHSASYSYSTLMLCLFGRRIRGRRRHRVSAVMVLRLWGAKVGHSTRPGSLRGSVVLVDKAAEDWPALDWLLGKVCGHVVGPGRADLAAAVRPWSVVVALVSIRDRSQVSFAENEHLVGLPRGSSPGEDGDSGDTAEVRSGGI